MPIGLGAWVWNTAANDDKVIAVCEIREVPLWRIEEAYDCAWSCVVDRSCKMMTDFILEWRIGVQEYGDANLELDGHGVDFCWRRSWNGKCLE